MPSGLSAWRGVSQEFRSLLPIRSSLFTGWIIAYEYFLSVRVVVVKIARKSVRGLL